MSSSVRSSAPVSPELLIALLADARLPTGGHAHSAGLEPAVLHGLAAGGSRPDEVLDYLVTRLRTVTATEAGTAVVARLRWLHGDRELGPVEAAWSARTPAPAVRAAARSLGRGYLRLARLLWPDELDGTFVDRVLVPRPVILGVVGAACGLSGRQVVQLVGYDDLQTVAAAALKLLPLDPVRAQQWVLGLLPQVDALAETLAGIGDPSQIPAAGAPMLDQFAQAHAGQTRRLFHA